MTGYEWLTEQFEGNRAHLRAVAYRMLGSIGEADDAVQETWLRLSRADTSGVDNLAGWLTTVVARVCLDMLRSRKSRCEERLSTHLPHSAVSHEHGRDLEHETLLAESVGLALLVVMERLAPAERLAFVLHDMFAVPFDEIAPLVGRSPAAARQLASRARRRVQGAATVSEAGLSHQRAVVDAFLTALRAGDFDALLAVLDPDVVRRADHAAVPAVADREVRGNAIVAKEALTHTARARFAQPVLVNGSVGIIVAPRGQLLMVLCCKVTAGKIVEIEVIADPARLSQLDLAVLHD
jgi:RNA polymerase sigma factor (sigma-70 family)